MRRTYKDLNKNSYAIYRRVFINEVRAELNKKQNVKSYEKKNKYTVEYFLQLNKLLKELETDKIPDQYLPENRFVFNRLKKKYLMNKYSKWFVLGGISFVLVIISIILLAAFKII
ncbi:hypothetical protein [Mycoplasma sp. 4404]|uniref:hypothetical protein n=1 Tax=Mycoplasma sp. 4404 TaxID=3108530 RepID=UPI002B1D60E7|nr:hypothetical protein [Mycoplasma sp. 4404]MEA4162587.1 hypothetical protein [Mycoplasma sp. 4404]